MEGKIIITKRFRNNTFCIYQYLLKEFSAQTAYNFLDQLEKGLSLLLKIQQQANAQLKDRMYTVFCLHRTTKFFTAIKKILL